jgi:glycosyltransferase involved in cell wall biosynthesis
MRFAVYHPWVYLQSGLERVFLEVMRRSRHDWTWYTSYYRPQETFPELADMAVVPIGREIPPLRSPLRAAVAAGSLLATKIPDGYDATLISLNGVSDLALARARRPVVGLCFTPLKAVFDPGARAATRERKPMKHVLTSLFAPPFVGMDRLLWRRLEHVVAISEETRDRIVRGGLTTPDRIDLAYPGVDLERFTPGLVDRPPRLLAAGRISWLKNLELAIDAVRELDRQARATELVIAGYLHPSDESYLASLRARAAGLPVQFVLRPTDAELTALYRECDLMLFTAINEDFGITPLEAMASGTPVVAVDAGGPRETVDDGRTGWLVDATAPAFAAAIGAWQARGDKAVIRTQARVQAERFNWQAFVDCVDRVMESSVNQPGR